MPQPAASPDPNPYESATTASHTPASRVSTLALALAGGAAGAVCGWLGPWLMGWMPPRILLQLPWPEQATTILGGALAGAFLGYTTGRWISGINALHRAAQTRQQLEDEFRRHREIANHHRQQRPDNADGVLPHD